MVTETTILISCFVVTFGIIGYKLSGLVKKLLDNYSQKIEDSLNESEILKMESTNALNEAKKKEKYLEDEIERIKDEADEKIKKMKNNFDLKLREITEKVINENKNKLLIEQNIIIENFKANLKETIQKVLEEYSQNLSEKDKENALKNIIEKVNFKELLK